MSLFNFRCKLSKGLTASRGLSGLTFITIIGALSTIVLAQTPATKPAGSTGQPATREDRPTIQATKTVVQQPELNPAPLGGGSDFIQNSIHQQIPSNFNVSGSGMADIFDAQTHFSLRGSRVLAVTGAGSFFAGINAGSGNTTGQGNTFVGNGAGQFGNGANNTSVGFAAGGFNTGDMNTYFGYASAGSFGLTNSTAIGANAFAAQDNSLVLGSINGINGATADTNVGIGTGSPAARLTVAEGDANMLVGKPTNCGNLSGFMVIGFNSTLDCANYSFGSDGTNTLIHRPAGGEVYFTRGSSLTADMLIESGGRVIVNTPLLAFGTLALELGTGGSEPLCQNSTAVVSQCSSSLRYKKNINPFTPGLNLVNRLTPITFDWIDSGKHDMGLGAEDVAKVDELLVVRNKKGEVEGVKYDRIGVVLINAVKEQQAQIDALRAELAELRKHAGSPHHTARHKAAR